MGKIQSPVYKHGGGDAQGTSVVQGARAGELFEDPARAASKRKADAFRKLKKKSFAWQPPKKTGLDPEWDAFDPDTIGGMLAK